VKLSFIRTIASRRYPVDAIDCGQVQFCSQVAGAISKLKALQAA
jgi:hypothetical protein